VTRKRHGGLIEYHDLAHSHALSFTNQPYLKDLFKEVLDRDRPLTLVVGAGVSINASLPSWPKLIDRIIDKIDDDDLKTLARGFQADPLRRAEFVLQLARRKNVSVEEHELIRDALYPKEYIARPGQLAESLARLVAVRPKKVRIITTNFDRLLEVALEEQLGRDRVKSYGLDHADEWVGLNSMDEVGVLHVHGAVTQAQAQESDPSRHVITPLILTESHYLKYGVKVRDRISQAFSDAIGLFVGLSLTDPNLIGPLYETTPKKRATPNRYAITVADLNEHQGHARERTAILAVESVRFLNDKLDLRPIIVKSYSQIEQVVSDLSLALAEPKRYFDSASRGRASLKYGARLDQALKTCYEAIGCNRNSFIPTGPSARNITEKLRTALASRKGPKKLLDEWTARRGIKFPDGEPERYGIHLWLRRPDSTGEPTYSLTLVGSSVFESKEPWYIERTVPVGSETDYAAAQAVHRGLWVMANMGPRRTVRVWRANVAVPIVLTGVASAAEVGGYLLDRLTVGALTLTTTRYIPAPEELAADPSMHENSSVITHLDAEALNELLARLVWAANKVLDRSKS
jgi:hypothetical protein